MTLIGALAVTGTLIYLHRAEENRIPPPPNTEPPAIEAPAPPPRTEPDEPDATAQFDQDLGQTVQPSTAPVDWEAAQRAALEARSVDPDAEDLVQAQAGGIPAPVPILLPTGVVMPQNAQPSFRQFEGGYFANYPGEAYNIVVNGTNQTYESPAAPTPRSVDDDAMTFTETESGASLSLTRFGADYLIEFECNTPLEPGGPNCITEEEALDWADRMIVVTQ